MLAAIFKSVADRFATRPDFCGSTRHFRHRAPARLGGTLTLESLEERRLLAVVSGTAASEVAVPLYQELTTVNSKGVVVPLASSGPTGMTPAEIKQAYGISSISFNGVTGNGAGETIAIVDAYDDPNIASDLQKFDAAFGLASPTLTKVNETGGSTMPAGNASWATEISLDVEWAHAIAPAANILLVEANSASFSDLLTAVNYARNAAGVVAVSMSWGGSEFSGETSEDSYFTTPAGHSGVAFFGASGDSGAPAEYPSASPNVIGVGGTTLNLNSSSNISSETAWSGSTGGLSEYESQPTYQKGVVTQSSTKRATPDVGYDANPNTGFPVYDTYGTGGTWAQYGGTSDAAPQWAAITAIADQGRALAGESALSGSQLLTDLYQLPSTDFNDVTSGSSTGSPTESATTGYDLVTGRGSPKANLIVSALVGSTSATPAAATHLSISAPSSSTAGGTFSITVSALSASNTTATGYLGTVHFSSSDVLAGLPANYTFTAADDGTHTFTGLSLDTAGSQSITATDTSTSSITGTTSVTVNPGTATHLVFSQAPSSALAGTAISPAVTVKVEDAYNNVLTGDSTDHVTVSLGTNPSGGTLSGTTTATVLAGIATFSNLSINLAGSGYTLAASSTATATGATSTTFNIGANVSASRFSVSAPSSSTAGGTFSITVTALTSAGATASSYAGTVHFSSSDMLAGLPANYTFTASDKGSHTFTGLALDTAGSQSITATDASTSSITGATAITVNPGTATHLVFSQAPSSAVVGAAISPAITVKLEDAYNNVLTGDSTDKVTLSLGSNPGSALLGGTTAVTVSSGVATFNNVSLSAAGTGYTLMASSTATAATVTSGSFNVTAVASSTLVEAFETPDTYDVVGGNSATASVSTAAAHNGSYGLVDSNGNDWIYRDDAAAQVKQGESISVWLEFSGTADGRAYFGFGSSAAGTLSLVAAPNTTQLILQSNSGYSFTDLAAVSQSWQANHWYRLEVDWGTGGTIVGKVFDSNGTTLLQSVTATNTSVTSGGVAFRAIGSNKYWDTVTESPLATGSNASSASTTRSTTTSSGISGLGGAFGSPWLEALGSGISAAGAKLPTGLSVGTLSVGSLSSALSAANAGAQRDSGFYSSLEELLLEESTLESLAQAKIAGRY